MRKNFNTDNVNNAPKYQKNQVITDEVPTVLFGRENESVKKVGILKKIYEELESSE